MVVIIVLIVILILAILIVPFLRDLTKDTIDLSENPIDKKFAIIAEIINKALLEGSGEIILFPKDKRRMNIFSQTHPNYIIHFEYGTGHLTIILKYKYFNQEMIYKEIFYNVRNISSYQQKNIAYQFINTSKEKIQEHNRKVGKTSSDSIVEIDEPIMANSDPTVVLGKTYDDLSRNQRMSIINLLYLIGKSGGFSDNEIQETQGFSQTLLSTNVRFDHSKEYLMKHGEERIYSDLNGINGGIITIVILTIMQMSTELSGGAEKISMDLNNCFLKMFKNLGYSEENIEKLLQMVYAMSNEFGIK